MAVCSINNAADVIISYACNFMTDLDLVMLCHVNKRMKAFVISHHIDLIEIKDEDTQNDLYYEASTNGYLDIFKYLDIINYTWNECCERAAALHGHLEILKYMKQNC